MADGVNGRIPNFKRNSGSDDDIQTLLAMRSNIVNYVHIIDINAPCVVKSSIWNRDTIMTQYCGDNAANFQEYILSISDEAFLLLVLINYSATWMAEIEEEHRKAPKYTFSRKTKRCSVARKPVAETSGIGWSEAGLERYNELYDLVVEDRVSRGGVFNNELLNVFVERRRDRKSAKQVCEPDAKKRRIVPKDDMGLYDTLFENVIATNVSRELHPSMQL
ncbi:hypothetical protein MHU86_16975 [Fragilaria crotonensis]|nr:hypothetical protein MHU86_16975 [Fragilaria crotonensis]